ncbi:putative MATH/TRAF domain-containing protein [Helianthus anomalus]
MGPFSVRRLLRVDYEMLVSEGSPQPMEDVADMIYAQDVDDHPSSRFTWAIKNFSTFHGEKMSSDPFVDRDVNGILILIRSSHDSLIV